MALEIYKRLRSLGTSARAELAVMEVKDAQERHTVQDEFYNAGLRLEMNGKTEWTGWDVMNAVHIERDTRAGKKSFTGGLSYGTFMGALRGLRERNLVESREVMVPDEEKPGKTRKTIKYHTTPPTSNRHENTM